MRNALIRSDSWATENVGDLGCSAWFPVELVGVFRKFTQLVISCDSTQEFHPIQFTTYSVYKSENHVYSVY